MGGYFFNFAEAKVAKLYHGGVLNQHRKKVFIESKRKA
jgi:hypothetical protein